MVQKPEPKQAIQGLRGVRALWGWWKRIAKKVAEIQVRAILVVFYFIIFCPFALVVRWRNDPLAIKPGAECGWRPLTEAEDSPIERGTKQF